MQQFIQRELTHSLFKLAGRKDSKNRNAKISSQASEQRHRKAYPKKSSSIHDRYEDSFFCKFNRSIVLKIITRLLNESASSSSNEVVDPTRGVKIVEKK